MPEMLGGVPKFSDKEAYRKYVDKAKQKNKLWQEKSVDTFPLEIYKVSDKLTIHAIPLEYTPGDVLEKHGNAITEAIQHSDGVIMEYFPQEIEKISSNLLVRARTNVDWFLPYYEHASAAAATAKKDVYVADPAHDYVFSIMRTMPSGVLTTGVLAATSGVSLEIMELPQILKLSGKNSSLPKKR